MFTPNPRGKAPGPSPPTDIETEQRHQELLYLRRLWFPWIPSSYQLLKETITAEQDVGHQKTEVSEPQKENEVHEEEPITAEDVTQHTDPSEPSESLEQVAEPELNTAVEQEQAMDSLLISQESEAPRKIYDELHDVVDNAQRQEDSMAESVESHEAQREFTELEKRSEIMAQDAEQMRAVEVRNITH
ncbi:hypothetical protein Y032_0609g614 [Ancylostoma ceylanicum]|uniref:Uncharacterized protein n=1 Tax=Ancylostoma ceylanicum TaxID=53326 RepID=A0A016WNB5_9BILA|nr:hypothetical protein Y032_0609g614 [Ancylostoma ceylanicum]